MRILQVSSDWKWTGPAEPMLRLSLALRARGHEVELACPEPPVRGARSLAAEARAAGLEPVLPLAARRGVHPIADRADARRLRCHARARVADLLHCWHTRDHALALRAAGLLPARRAPRIVRSFRSAGAIPATPWNRWLYGAGTDGLVCVSPGTARRNRTLRRGRPLAGSFGAVDLERFRPLPPRPELRAALGLAPGHRVLGVVARVQRQRRFDLLLEAAMRLFRDDPEARLLVVGRGTHRAELAERPAAQLGIADRVVFAGYRGDDFADVLRLCDVLCFLVPGSDGTCRALLEAAACGIPAVTSRRGALPEIVLHGETGLVVDETPEALVRAWSELLGDAGRRRTLGAAARARARSHFAPERLADAVEGLYREVLER